MSDEQRVRFRLDGRVVLVTGAGQLSFTRHLAAEVGRHGVTVNAIALGLMENAAAAVPPSMLRAIPVGRAGTGRDIGTTVVWLAAEGEWVSGQTVSVNGGAQMR